MRRKETRRVYNRIKDDYCDEYPLGALLTDCELERAKRASIRPWTYKTERVSAKGMYFFFGMRFCDEYKVITL